MKRAAARLEPGLSAAERQYALDRADGDHGARAWTPTACAAAASWTT